MASSYEISACTLAGQKRAKGPLPHQLPSVTALATGYTSLLGETNASMAGRAPDHVRIVGPVNANPFLSKQMLEPATLSQMMATEAKRTSFAMTPNEMPLAYRVVT